MKLSRFAVRCKTSALPRLRFEDQQMTSYAGLVIFQQLFEQLQLKSRLIKCHCRTRGTSAYPFSIIVLLLIVHMLLGYRRLRSVRYYQDDPLVLRVLGLNRLPSVSTLSRQLANVRHGEVDRLASLQRSLVQDRLKQLSLPRITLDFDGTVISTCRHAEGVAVGWNRKKRGQRSYYPLYCTVAQSSQVLDVKQRSGNVHDSNGALAFMLECVDLVREKQPKVTLEARMDSAFLDQKIIQALTRSNVEFSISVPVNRYPSILEMIQSRRRWKHLDRGRSYFEVQWAMDSWTIPEQRFVFVRQRVSKQIKGPLQLDLFKPQQYEYQYKLIVTNKTVRAKALIEFHDGRGSQEGLFAELKSQLAMGYIPTNHWNGNKVYLLAASMAHNLTRELQMRQRPPERQTLGKRPALWQFMQLETLRRTVIQRAGRLIRPQGKLTLCLSANQVLKQQLESWLYSTPSTT